MAAPKVGSERPVMKTFADITRAIKKYGEEVIEDQYERQARLQMEQQQREHEEKLAKYQSVLDRYREEREKAKSLEGYLFPKVAQPFQMAIPDEYQLDFSKGIGEAMTKVKDKFVGAIITDIKPQIRDHLTVDPFIHKDGQAKLGITIYLLSEEDIMDLEDKIREEIRLEYEEAKKVA